MLMFDSSRLYNHDKTVFSLTGGLKFIIVAGLENLTLVSV